MTHSPSDGSFLPVRRHLISSRPEDDGRRSCLQGIQGRVSVAELLAHLAETVPHIPLEEVGFNAATLMWVDEATPEEAAERAAWRAHHAARREEGERAAYERLKAKYEGTVPATPAD